MEAGKVNRICDAPPPFVGGAFFLGLVLRMNSLEWKRLNCAKVFHYAKTGLHMQSGFIMYAG